MNDWRTPTTWGQRFREALTLLCGEPPPDGAVLESLRPDSDGWALQNWTADKCRLSWAQGAVVIDAATILADTPAEGEQADGSQIHEDRKPPNTANNPACPPGHVRR